MTGRPAAEAGGPVGLLKVLAHDLRWRLLRELATSDLRVGELVDRVRQPPGLVSYHLAQLRQAGLVHERRSEADGRDIYYHLDLERLRTGLRDIGPSLHPAIADGPAVRAVLRTRRQRVLFLCTSNSARSQMAEAILRRLGGDRIDAFSAGTEPTSLHPLAVRVMAEQNIDMAQQRSKHVSQLIGDPFDLVISLCDRVREACPAFRSRPDRVHWSLSDPAAADRDEAAALEAFRRTAAELQTRIADLVVALGRGRQIESI
jgi:ArsR family transcriptional regulator, arsenate/arsenite/antimonite-responsive transcriptional repressor / arsenate reductase (thioredoxin)